MHRSAKWILPLVFISMILSVYIGVHVAQHVAVSTNYFIRSCSCPTGDCAENLDCDVEISSCYMDGKVFKTRNNICYAEDAYK